MKTFCKCSATLVLGLIALMDCVSVSCPRRAARMACGRWLAVFWLSFTSPLPQPVENIDKGSSHSPTEPWHGPGSQHQSTEFSSWNKFTCQPHSRRIMALMRNVTKCPRGEDASCDKVVQGQSSSPGERLAMQPVTFFRCGLFSSLAQLKSAEHFLCLHAREEEARKGIIRRYHFTLTVSATAV